MDAGRAWTYHELLSALGEPRRSASYADGEAYLEWDCRGAWSRLSRGADRVERDARTCKARSEDGKLWQFVRSCSAHAAVLPGGRA